LQIFKPFPIKYYDKSFKNPSSKIKSPSANAKGLKIVLAPPSGQLQNFLVG